MLPAGATFTCCDILDASSVTNAVDSARQLVMAIGFAYEGSTWRASWPRAICRSVSFSPSVAARPSRRAGVHSIRTCPIITWTIMRCQLVRATVFDQDLI
jgi:hypothetical protein